MVIQLKSRSPQVIRLVAAYTTPFRVIGANGKLPWRYEEDLHRFRMCVEHSILVGGPKTLKEVAFLKQETIPVHRDTDWEVIADIGEHHNLSIIGGEAVFAAGIHYAKVLHLTEITKFYDGDRFFPVIPKEFQCVSRIQSSQNPDLIFSKWRR